MKQVDEGQISTMKITKRTFRTLALRHSEGLMLELSTSLSLHGGNLTLINLFIPHFKVSQYSVKYIGKEVRTHMAPKQTVVLKIFKALLQH